MSPVRLRTPLRQRLKEHVLADPELVGDQVDDPPRLFPAARVEDDIQGDRGALTGGHYLAEDLMVPVARPTLEP